MISGGSQVPDRVHRGGVQEGPGRVAEGDHQPPDLHERRRPRNQETSHSGKKSMQKIDWMFISQNVKVNLN